MQSVSESRWCRIGKSSNGALEGVVEGVDEMGTHGAFRV